MKWNNSSKINKEFPMSLHPYPQPCSLYEQEELSAITSGMLRPGGVELTTRAVRLCGLPPGAAVLDVGCGPGHTLSLLATRFQFNPVGLDKSDSLLRQAATANPAITLVQGEATAIPLRDAGFDGLICECVLSLTGDIATSLCEMGRVLTPGGKLALTDIFVRGTEEQGKSAIPAMCNCLTAALPLQTIKAAIETAGFSILRIEDHSAALKQLAGQIIFSFGSLEAFWGLFMDKEEAHNVCCSLSAARPGYYLLIAEKKRD